MQDIMQELDIAKGTIYHYFKSKDELLEAVVEELVDAELARQQEVLEQAEGSALDKIQTLVTSSNISEEHEQILEQMHSPQNTGMHNRQLAVTILKLSPILGELIEQGVEEGLFQTENPLECAEFMLSAVQFLTDEGIYAWQEEDLVRRALAFPALIESLLQAPAGSFHFLLQQI
jgi:AcrR family transcriptional regulator